MVAQSIESMEASSSSGARETRNMISEYPWGQLYETAILETDPSKLTKHIQVAKQAIMARVQELNTDHGGTIEERTAIRDALSGLQVLEKEVLRNVAEGNFGRGTAGDLGLGSNSGRGGQDLS